MKNVKTQLLIICRKILSTVYHSAIKNRSNGSGFSDILSTLCVIAEKSVEQMQVSVILMSKMSKHHH